MKHTAHGGHKNKDLETFDDFNLNNDGFNDKSELFIILNSTKAPTPI